jgi:DNA-binding MarR family transcriptional regulator
MEPHEINTLKILKELEENPAQTQRDLSKKLKISLGLVNAFTKRLTKKGYFKITTVPKNRIQYIITPKGLAEKTRLVYQYILHSLKFYNDTRSKFKTLFMSLSDQNKKRVFFFGVSELAEIGYIVFQETDLELAGIFDEGAKGDKFMGMTIKGLSDLDEISSRDVVIITKIGNSKSVNEQLAHNDLSLENVVDLNRYL